MEIEKNLNTSNKRLLDEVEEILVDTFATVAYKISIKKTYNNDNSSKHSAWNPMRSLVPK